MALVDLNYVKSILGISGTSNDTQIAYFISKATGDIEAYTDQTFEQTTYTDEVLEYEFSTFDSIAYNDVDINYGVPALFVEHAPILEASGFTLKYKDTVIDTGSYKVNYEAGVIYMYNIQTDCQRNLTATYTAGYTTGTAPSDLVSVIMDGVRYYYEIGVLAVNGRLKTKSKRVKNFSVTYSDTTTAQFVNGERSYIAANKNILDKYKRTV